MEAIELLKRYNDGEKDIVFDVRDKAIYDKYHMPHAINVDANSLMRNPLQYIKDKDKPVYVTCNSGNTSGVVMMMLKQKAFNVVSVRKGMNPLMEKLGMETAACKMQ